LRSGVRPVASGGEGSGVNESSEPVYEFGAMPKERKLTELVPLMVAPIPPRHSEVYVCLLYEWARQPARMSTHAVVILENALEDDKP
jgi:hypothetical protein